MTDRPGLSVRDAATVDRDDPWPGLAAFREADRHFFHGRERAIDEIVRLVLRAPVTVLFGLSGLGKTSLLRAGVFPPLREASLLPVYLRLSHADDSVDLRVQVREAVEDAAVGAGVETPAWDAGWTLWEYFHRKDVRFWNERNRIVTPLLVFDQFEEIFTQGRLSGARTARTAKFITELSDLVEGRPPASVRARFEDSPDEALHYSLTDRPCKVLISLREDFLPDLSSLRGEMPSIGETSYRLQRMTAEEALEVVQLDGGRLVDRDVADEIVDFVASAKVEGVFGEAATRTVEPALLSVFCRELNAKRRHQGREKITADLLQGSAGTQIILDFYENTVAESGLRPAARRFVEERLVTESGFRNSVAEEEALGELTADELEGLISRRLLRREDMGTPGRARIELTHDVLAEPVRLSRDKRRLREEEEQRRTEAEAAAERERQRQDQQRRELEAALALAAKEREASEIAHNLALERQRAAEQTVRIERAARARQRWLMAGLAILVLAATYSWFSARTAARNAREALATTDVYRAMLGDEQPLALLADAVRNDPDNTLARASLISALSRQPRFVSELGRWNGTVVLDADGTHLLRVSDQEIEIWDIARGESLGRQALSGGELHAVFTADDARFLTTERVGPADATEVRVWDMRTVELVSTPFTVTEPIADLNANADGTRVVLVSESGAVRVWDTPRGEAIGSALTGVAVATLSPDGATLLTLSYDGTAELWPVGAGAGTARPLGARGSTASASFSPLGDRVVTVSLSDFTAQVWDVRSGAPIGRAMEHDAAIKFARMSRDAARVLTVTANRAARLWSLTATESETADVMPLGITMLHEQPVTNAVFSADGMRVISVSGDRTVRVWDAWTGRPTAAPLRYRRPVTDAAMSRDGELITVTSGPSDVSEPDAYVEVHDARTGTIVGLPLPHGGPVSGAVFTADGDDVATTSADSDGGIVTVWDARTGERVRSPARYRGHVLALAIRPDGEVAVVEGDGDGVGIWPVATPEALVRLAHAIPVISASADRQLTRVATASADGGVRVWDANTGEAIGATIRPTEQITTAAISPDGSKVLVVTTTDEAQVWDLSSETLRSVFEQDLVAFGTFSPDGEHVVTASSDGIARVWHIESGEEVGSPLVHAGAILSAAFSPDGERLVTVSADQSARVWHVRTGFPISQPLWHRDMVVAAGFSPDGNRVVTASTDGTARVWDVPLGSASDVGRLADLAEADGGYRIDEENLTRTLNRARILDELQAEGGPSGQATGSRLVARWLVADPWTRSVSPLSRLSVPEYIGRLLEGEEVSACLEAWRTYPGHPSLRPCADGFPNRAASSAPAGR